MWAVKTSEIIQILHRWEYLDKHRVIYRISPIGTVHHCTFFRNYKQRTVNHFLHRPSLYEHFYRIYIIAEIQYGKGLRINLEFLLKNTI